MIINVVEGETLAEFVARVRKTLPPDIPPAPPGWNELMDVKSDPVAEKPKKEEETEDGDS